VYGGSLKLSSWLEMGRKLRWLKKHEDLED
jgi:hypothetical protein